MLQLKNNTPFAANIALFPNEDGVDSLYLIVKASFNIGPKWTLLDDQPSPLEADIYWGEPESSSLQYASDYHTGKPGTDIIMTGLACAPNSRSVHKLDVSLSVGSVSKTISVFGDRQWLDGNMTDPLNFTTMPMVYEKAYGGMHLMNGEIESAEERNPLGCGYVGGQKVSEVNGVSLPNLEDPAQLIKKHSDRPTPACFAICSPAWQPRAAYAGTYDESWQTERAPYLPKDFDSRFLNMAHPDLIYPGFIQGDEPVSISGMHPSGTLNFNLPRVELLSKIKSGTQLHSAPFSLETIHLEPNQLRLSVVWKATYPCDKKTNKIDKIDIGLRH